MQNVTIVKKDGTSHVIPIANLENTLRILGDSVKKVDYGTVHIPAKAEPKTPDMTWTKKKLLKYARDKGVEVQDNDTKSMILKAIQ